MKKEHFDTLKEKIKNADFLFVILPSFPQYIYYFQHNKTKLYLTVQKNYSMMTPSVSFNLVST